MKESKWKMKRNMKRKAEGKEKKKQKEEFVNLFYVTPDIYCFI